MKSCKDTKKNLRVQSVQGFSGTGSFRGRVPNRNPGYCSFDAHTETAVRDAAEFTQIQIPLERLFGQAVLVNTLQQEFV
jgi:hypothetical protein